MHPQGSFSLDQPEFRRPVCESQAQALRVRVPITKLGFDTCDFALASGDSCRHLAALFGDGLEGSAIAFESGLVADVILPPCDDAIHILGINLK